MFEQIFGKKEEIKKAGEDLMKLAKEVEGIVESIKPTKGIDGREIPKLNL